MVGRFTTRKNVRDKRSRGPTFSECQVLDFERSLLTTSSRNPESYTGGIDQGEARSVHKKAPECVRDDPIEATSAAGWSREEGGKKVPHSAIE